MTESNLDQSIGGGRRFRSTRRRLMATGLFGGILAKTLGAQPGNAAALPVALQSECSLGCTESICGQVPPDCPVFPADNYWNTPIADLPVVPLSDAYIASIGADTVLHPDFGSGLYDDQPLGIPFVRVPADQPGVEVNFDAAEESDPGPYPIPPDAPVEGGSCSGGDRHVIVVQEGTCQLYEMYDAAQQDDGSWYAYGGARFDLNSNALRPDEWTSADAGGFPILPGLVRYEEIEGGVIPHALRFTSPETQQTYIWPARHHAGASDDTNLPPMGQRFRLKADTDISSFSPVNQIILQALKTYGMVLADNGGSLFLSGTPDDRWNNDDLHQLQNDIHGSDFEAVDATSLMVDPDSAQARSQ